ncbi:hypothetical protein B296_00015696 [Ensete ventricosum]|uniref:Uncharacterized protein n=1 Tax=Ensete ventricosum TaxID=4639 RepID=A0A426YIU2_ENSVE|nr:hypothetical protein B296_00015696 [Ensete ventricosum]
MAGLEIGGWFASIFLARLADQVGSYIGKQLKYQKGAKTKLNQLEANLRKIHAVIHATDLGRYQRAAHLEAWLWELRDAAFEAEDLLDGFEYQILRDTAKGKHKVHSNFSFASSSFAQSTTAFFKRLFFRDEDLNELDKVIERFDKIVATIGNFPLPSHLGAQNQQHGVLFADAQRDVPEWRETTSIMNESEVLGREHEINSLDSMNGGQSGKYVVHDLLHHLAESLSAHEYCRVEDDESEEIPERVCHVYVSSSNLAKLYETAPKLKNLRSLVVNGSLLDTVAKSKLMEFLKVTLKRLKRLRVIVIDGLVLDVLPEGIGHMRHLRYLEVPGDQLIDLPKWICRLYQLQGLSLQFRSPLLHLGRPLPRGIHRLVNIRYLNINPEKVSTIFKIGKLRSLQELREFHVRKGNGYELGQLRDMRQLRGQLSIMNLDMAGSASECRAAELDNKEHLSALHLYWGQLGRKGIDKHEEVLEALWPHRNLSELRIIGYMGTKSPSWMETSWLSNLEHIELEDCQGWEVLPPLGQLPFLKILHLKSLKLVKNIFSEFYGGHSIAFPLLEELLFSDMGEWRQWSGAKASSQLFPRLRRLQIDRCHKLRGSLVLPTVLERLHIVLSDDVTWESYEKPHVVLSDDVIWESSETNDISSILKLSIDNIALLTDCLPAECLPSLYRLDVVYCSSLESFTDEQEKWLQRLSSLEELRFSDCDNLTRLPTDLNSLALLKTLHIEGCPRIDSQPEKGI